MNVCLLSDIHANLTALDAVLAHLRAKYGDGLPVFHLGDAVDYGMRPVETLRRLQDLAPRFVVNLRGNHEMALDGVEDDRFSSPRGRAANEFTRRILDDASRRFVAAMAPSPVSLPFMGKSVLCVHGDLHDRYWGKMPESEMLSPDYRPFDFVFCGHTHVPCLKCLVDKAARRKTVFVNPGSVGQPRNANPAAQYAVVDFDTGAVSFECVPYDIAAEQALFHGEVHPYYKERLRFGI